MPTSRQLGMNKTDARERRLPSWLIRTSRLREYTIALLTVGLVTVANFLALPVIGYQSAAIVYLCGISVLATFVGRGPVLLSTALSVFLWFFCFIPPRFTMLVSNPEDFLLLDTYFVVALVLAMLITRIRSQEIALQRREQHSRALYTLAREVSSARTLDEVLETAVKQIERAFDAEAAILIVQPTGELLPQPHPASTLEMTDQELKAATRALTSHKQAGRFTDTLASAQAQYFPLQAPSGIVGVMGVRMRSPERPTLDQQTLLEMFSRQVALVIERTTLDEAARQASVLAESEHLYQTLFNSISHELRTPLATILGGSAGLLDPNISRNASVRNGLSQEIQQAAIRLNRVVDNLLDMTRLESGKLKPNLEWCDVSDLISVTLGRARGDLAGRPIKLEITSDLPLVQFDFGLMEQALYNLLHNEAVHTPPGTGVWVAANVQDRELVISVADCGPGLPTDDVPCVFDKFYRAPGAPAGGIGLGLPVTRGLVEAHGGKITAENLADGGVRFEIRLPLGSPPKIEIPDEDAS